MIAGPQDDSISQDAAFWQLHISKVMWSHAGICDRLGVLERRLETQEKHSE
jgi:hypothetical protein